MSCTIDDIDIFILTHNRAEYLEETIRSVLRQTEAVKTFYVLDNESTDNTEEVAAGYAAQGCRYVKTCGRYGNFFKAQELARGKYVLTFHDDDLLHPEFLEKMLIGLNAVPDAAYGVSTFTWFPVDVMASELPKLYEKQLPWEYLYPRHMTDEFLVLKDSFDVTRAILFAESYYPCNPCICSVLYRTDIFRKRVPLNDRYGKLDDTPLLIRMAKEGRAFIYLDHRAVFHRTHERRDAYNPDTANTLEQSYNWAKAYADELRGHDCPDLYRKLVNMICNIYPVVTRKDVVERYPAERLIRMLAERGDAPSFITKFQTHGYVRPEIAARNPVLLSADRYFPSEHVRDILQTMKLICLWKLSVGKRRRRYKQAVQERNPRTGLFWALKESFRLHRMTR